MRKLKRAVARNRMIRAGWTNLNRKGAGNKSKFALYWRQFAAAK
jgi:hypothetical protein